MTLDSGASIMIRVLPRGHLLQLRRRRVIVRPLAGQGVQRPEGREPALEAVLDFRRNAARLVETADRDADAVTSRYE
jgi:hypothetical protein